MIIIPDLAGGVDLHVEDSGPRDGPAVVFAHALGSDLNMWNALLPLLPPGLRLIRMDMRGHGQSPCPEGPYPMGDLVKDAGRVLENLGLRDCVFVGISIGGIIAQGLAAERLDLVRGLVLSNTAVKIGTPEIWQKRITSVRENGLSPLIDPTMERWFARSTARDHPDRIEAARSTMQATNLDGYIACMEAIADTDLYSSTAQLRLPTLVIAGTEDGSTPADLVRETAGLIPGAQFELVRRAGHMPPVEQPDAVAALISKFLKDIGHI